MQAKKQISFEIDSQNEFLIFVDGSEIGYAERIGLVWWVTLPGMGSLKIGNMSLSDAMERLSGILQ